MKKLFFWGAGLVALASQPAWAQTGGPDVVMVRVMETGNRAQVVIERPGQAAEEINFTWSIKLSQTPAKGYYSALAKLFADGYQVQATIPGVTYASGAFVYSTLIFTRPTATSGH